MKKYEKGIKFIVVILLCFILIEFDTNFLYAVDDVDIFEATNVEDDSITSTTLKPIISAPVIDINSSVRVSFDNTDVLSYNVETDGLIATEVASGSMEYDIVAIEDFGVLDVYATYHENVVVKSSVYTYKVNNKVYISDVSKDQAWYSWIEELVDLGELAINAAQELYYELCGGYTEEYTPTVDELLTNNTVSGKTIVQGKLFWQKDTTVIAPLIKAKVQLIKKVNGMTYVIDSLYSNPDGSFKFEIDNSCWNDGGEDIFIRWWLEAETFKITNNWILDHYCFQSSLITNVSEGSVNNFYYIIPKDEDLIHYRATYVHQAMTISERFAIAMGMTVPNYSSEGESKTKLNVSYPALLAPENAGYSFGNDLQSLAAIGTNSYADIDLITHEYGHYVQYLMDIYGSNLLEIICNGPQHHPLEDHMLDNLTKEYAMELTWSESWATTFSTLSEHYYYYKTDMEYGYFDYKDEEYGIMADNSSLGWDLETPNNASYDHDDDSSTPGRDNRGEFQEMSVKALLWDLYDDSTSESFDQINFGYRDWWYYTTRSNMYTLEDFTQYMDEHRPDLRDKMGKIMSYYKIAPEIVSVSDCGKNSPPTIKWIVNGSVEHPNNRFEILFYDINGRLLAKSDNITVNVSHRNQYTHTVCESVWNEVLEQLDYECNQEYKINIAIAGYRFDSILIENVIGIKSGPYYSSYNKKTIVINHDLSYEKSNTTHHKLICNDCNEETLQKHTFEYPQIQQSYHSKICIDCGYSVSSQSHIFAYRTIGPLQHEKYCIDCGYVISTESHVLKLTGGVGNLKPCQLCGAMVNVGGGGGGIFPVDPNKENDPEEETEKF